MILGEALTRREMLPSQSERIVALSEKTMTRAKTQTQPSFGETENYSFGEFTGYYGSGEEQEPVLEVKAVYFRNDPINLRATFGHEQPIWLSCL